MIILDDTLERWNEEPDALDKIIPSKRFIIWRHLAPTKERVNAPFVLGNSKASLDAGYNKVYLVVYYNEGR